MITTIGLDLGTIPHGGDKWRLVVRDKGLTPNGATLGRRWYNGEGSGYSGVFADNGISTMQKGYPASQPVSSGAYFCMDVRFPSVPPALPLSQLALDWTARLGGEVVRVKRVPAGESSSAGQSDRVAQLEAAIEDAPRGFLGTVADTAKGAADAGQKALDVLQLAFWAVIIGGVVYLYSKARTFQK